MFRKQAINRKTSRRRSDRRHVADARPATPSAAQTDVPSTPPRRPERPIDAITGYTPGDAGTEAPTAVPDAQAEFAAVLGPAVGTEVEDPRYALTAEDRLRQREELELFVKAQRKGEELSGVVPRR